MRNALPLAPLVLLLFACASRPGAAPTPDRPPPVATFSIVARDAETGDLGVAVQSRFLGVGSVVPWARAGVGAVATQAWANTTWGPDGLALLEKGAAPGEVVGILTRRDPGREFRQMGIVADDGEAAAFTGEEAMSWAGHVVGDGYACQGNILAGEDVVTAMATAFEESDAPFPERLVAALLAGQVAGGDRRGRQSAALLVVRRQGGYSGFNDRMIDLRVEDHETPIRELSRILALHRRTFGKAPLPGEWDEYRREPAPEPGSLATPRGAWAVFLDRFASRDFEALRALQTRAYRDEHPLSEYVATMEARYDEMKRFLDRATYAGTRIDGDRARIALETETPGSRRPLPVDLVREEGEWRFPD